MTKIAGFGSESGAISQRHGYADPDPDPHKNVPEHCQLQYRESICRLYEKIITKGSYIYLVPDNLPTRTTKNSYVRLENAQTVC
jgi:hypothetical protein